MTDKEYKALSIKEFAKAAKIYEKTAAGQIKEFPRDIPNKNIMK